MVKTKLTPRKATQLHHAKNDRGRPKIGPRKMNASENYRRMVWRRKFFDYNPFTFRLKWIGMGPSPLGPFPTYDLEMVRLHEQLNLELLKKETKSEHEGDCTTAGEEVEKRGYDKKEEEERLLAIKVFGHDDMVFVEKMRNQYQANKCRPSYVPLYRCDKN